MPSAVRYLVIVLVVVGTTALSWGIGSLLGWNHPMIRWGEIIFMNSGGAIGLGVGTLAGAVTTLLLFRTPAPSRDLRKSPTEPDDFR
jgi:hypothetical protein